MYDNMHVYVLTGMHVYLFFQVCAPRWINPYDNGITLKMTGSCYLLDQSLENTVVRKMNTLKKIGKKGKAY